MTKIKKNPCNSEVGFFPGKDFRCFFFAFFVFVQRQYSANILQLSYIWTADRCRKLGLANITNQWRPDLPEYFCSVRTAMCGCCPQFEYRPQNSVMCLLSDLGNAAEFQLPGWMWIWLFRGSSPEASAGQQVSRDSLSSPYNSGHKSFTSSLPALREGNPPLDLETPVIH